MDGLPRRSERKAGFRSVGDQTGESSLFGSRVSWKLRSDSRWIPKDRSESRQIPATRHRLRTRLDLGFGWQGSCRSSPRVPQLALSRRSPTKWRLSRLSGASRGVIVVSSRVLRPCRQVDVYFGASARNGNIHFTWAKGFELTAAPHGSGYGVGSGDDAMERK